MARVAAVLQTGRDALPEAPNDGSLLAFARTPFAIDRLFALGVSPDRKDHWGIAPIEAMSRLGSGGRALVSYMIARGVTATPQEYARLGDRDKLAALIDSDPAIARSNGDDGRRRFSSPRPCPLAARSRAPMRMPNGPQVAPKRAPFRRLER